MKKLISFIALLCFSTVLFAVTTVTYEPLEMRDGTYYTTTSGYVAPTGDKYYYRYGGVDKTCYTTAQPGLSANVGPISVNTGGTTYSYYCY